MKNLQILALKQAINDLEQASNMVLMKSDKPDFGDPTRRNTPAGEVLGLMRSAQEWIEAVSEECV